MIPTLFIIEGIPPKIVVVHLKLILSKKSFHMNPIYKPVIYIS